LAVQKIIIKSVVVFDSTGRHSDPVKKGLRV